LKVFGGGCVARFAAPAKAFKADARMRTAGQAADTLHWAATDIDEPTWTALADPPEASVSAAFEHPADRGGIIAADGQRSTLRWLQL